jgi:hypothetical protein
MPRKAAAAKIRGVVEKNNVIDTREVDCDLNWFKQLKVAFSALCGYTGFAEPGASFVRVKFVIVVFWAVILRFCR